jgi:hypothetical protein
MTFQDRKDRFESEPGFKIEVPGGTAEELQRGMAAAQAVFAAAGVTPLEAATAQFVVEGELDGPPICGPNDGALPPVMPTDGQYEIAGIWR